MNGDLEREAIDRAYGKVIEDIFGQIFSRMAMYGDGYLVEDLIDKARNGFASAKKTRDLMNSLVEK